MARPLLALCFGWLVVACTAEDSGRELEQAVQDAQRHRAAFESFERWAARALDRPSLQVGPALEETLFAPLRLESGVLDAWVDVEGPRVATLALRAKPGRPTGVRWRQLRGQGGMEVARADRPIRYPTAGERVEAVMVRRRRKLGSTGQLTVTMALRDTASGAP